MIELPELRPYQEALVQEVRGALVKHRSVIVCMPPGAGKTRTAKYILGMYLNRPKREGESGKAAFMVHRRGLVENASNSCNESPRLPHGVIMSGCDTGPGYDIQVASIDTKNSWYVDGGNYRSDFTYDFLVFDEIHAHVAKFRTFLKAHTAKREELGLKPAFILGLSATPQHKELNKVFNHIVTGPSPSWLIDNGFLSPFRYFQATQGKLGLLVKKGDDYTEDSVAEAMQGLAGDLVRDWKKLAEGRATVGFFPRRSHAYEAMELLRANGIDAHYVDGETNDEERQSLFKRLNSGEIQYICNVGVIERGTDIPRVGCVQLCTAIGSVVRYCLSEDTDILTPSGWKGIDDDITEAYQVDESLSCSVGIVSDRVERIADVPMYGIDGRSLSIRVSENHRMLIKPRRGSVKTQMSQELPCEFSIPVSCFEESEGVPVTDDEIRFLGLVATDGCINKSNNVIKIFQSERHPECIEYIEKVLDCCGFWWVKGRIKSPSDDAKIKERHARWEYRVSYGNPLTIENRKSGRTGWKRLKDWVSKTPHVKLANCTRKQLLVLLEAMIVGDGDKHKCASIDWTPKTIRVAVSNKETAEGLQSLCVRRGVRCVLTDNGCGVNCLLVDTSRQWWTVTSNAKDGRDNWSVLPLRDGERMWCVSVPSGYLIARRNGKPFIVGNCQMVGRGSRVHPDKTDCIVLDHANNVRKHGFFEDDKAWTLEWGERPAKTHEPRATISCPSCGAIYRGGKCRACGYEPTGKDRKSQGLEFVGGELKEVTKSSQKEPKKYTCEQMMTIALFKAGHIGGTWGQAWSIAKRMAEKQGTAFRVPATVEVAGYRYKTIPYGHPDCKRKVRDTYGFTVGKYNKEHNPYRT